MTWLYKRLRIAVLEWRLARLMDAHRKIMNEPGATTRWTLEAMHQNAAPIRKLQLEIQSLWESL